jgi:hypothetical protein
MILLISWLLLSVVVGVFANSQGRSGVGWFFLSLLFSPLIGLALVRGGRVSPRSAISRFRNRTMIRRPLMSRPQLIELFAISGFAAS